MAFLGTSICYLDQVNLSVAVLYIQENLSLDSFQLELILNGVFFQLVRRYLVDRFETRLTYVAAVTISVGLGVVSPTCPDASFRLKAA